MLAGVYVPNRTLLIDAIREEPEILEMIVRCLPQVEAANSKNARQAGVRGGANKSGGKQSKNADKRESVSGGARGKHAELLLEEIGLGKTLPTQVLDEFYRLRRLIPLDNRFWRCDALRALPPTLPPLLLHLFERDKVKCAIPKQPEMTPWELNMYRIRRTIYWCFTLTSVVCFLVTLYTLLYGLDCTLTLAILTLSGVSLVSLCYANVLGNMVKLGVGTQVAIICCPLVCCNLIALIGSIVWAALVLFVTPKGLTECNIVFMMISRAMLAFIGMGLGTSLARIARSQSSKMWKCIFGRFSRASGAKSAAGEAPAEGIEARV